MTLAESLPDPGIVARKVLQSALSKMIEAPLTTNKIGKDFSDRWIRALHDGFTTFYSDQERFAVFSRALPASGPTRSWRRHEYLYDIAVVEAECRPGPIRSSASVPIITRCLWQVESEVELDMSKVSEDLGKLVCGSAVSKLLIAAVPVAQENFENWKSFIEYAATHVQNNFFLALIPTYSTLTSAHTTYRTKQASIRFFTRIEGRLEEAPEQIDYLTGRTEEAPQAEPSP